MRAVRFSGRLGGGGVCPGGVCLVVSAGEGGSGFYLGGCLPRGCLPKGGVCPRGVHLPLPVNRNTDRCKSITFPQLRLRTVTIQTTFHMVTVT